MIEGVRDACKECKWVKYKQSGACYCVKYGIIIGYPKMWCGGFEEREQDEQVQEQKMGVGRANV